MTLGCAVSNPAGGAGACGRLPEFTLSKAQHMNRQIGCRITLFNLQFLFGRKRSGALYGVMGFPSDLRPCKVIVSINASRIYRSRSYMYNVSAYRNRSLSFFFGNYSVRDDPVAQVCIGIGMVITPGRGI